MSELKILNGVVVPNDSGEKILEHGLKTTISKPIASQTGTVKTTVKK